MFPGRSHFSAALQYARCSRAPHRAPPSGGQMGINGGRRHLLARWSRAAIRWQDWPESAMAKMRRTVGAAPHPPRFCFSRWCILIAIHRLPPMNCPLAVCPALHFDLLGNVLAYISFMMARKGVMSLAEESTPVSMPSSRKCTVPDARENTAPYIVSGHDVITAQPA